MDGRELGDPETTPGSTSGVTLPHSDEYTRCPEQQQPRDDNSPEKSSLAPSGPYTLPREYRALYVCGRTDSPRFRVSKGRRTSEGLTAEQGGRGLSPPGVPSEALRWNA
ncbi:unnamed protein product [Gadus morhua 'NCC']